MIRRLAFSGLLAASAIVPSGCGTGGADAAPGRPAVVAGPGATPTAPRAASAKKLSFNEHIQPILAENCYACHGTDPGSRKAELRLDRLEHATAKRKDGGPAIVPGRPDDSPLVQRIEATDEKKIMPPPESHKSLKPAQVATLRRWIAEGAEYEEHWSFIAPRRPAVPVRSDRVISNQSISNRSNESNQRRMTDPLITDYSNPA
jgi:hypothetical protein